MSLNCERQFQQAQAGYNFPGLIFLHIKNRLVRLAWFVVMLIHFSSMAIQAQDFPVGSKQSCEDEISITKDVEITEVDRTLDGTLTASIKVSSGSGKSPEFGIVYVGTENGPNLEALSGLGKQFTGDSRTAYTVLTGLNTSKVIFSGLNPNAAYHVFAAGYRCKYSRTDASGRFLSRWKTTFVDGGSHIDLFKTGGSPTECNNIVPFVERFELSAIPGAANSNATLIHARIPLCGDVDNSSIPYALKFGGLSGLSIAQPEISSIISNSAEEFVGDLVGTIGLDALSNWHGYKFVGDGNRLWGDLFYLSSGTLPDFTIEFYGTERKYIFISRKSDDRWIDSRSKEISILMTAAGTDFPILDGVVVPLATARLASAVSLITSSSSKVDGGDLISYYPNLWSTSSQIPASDLKKRAKAIFSGNPNSLIKRLKNGLSQGGSIEYTNSDALLSTDGWVKLSGNPLSNIPPASTLEISTSANIQLFYRDQNWKYFPLTQTSSSTNKTKIKLSEKPNSSSADLYSLIAGNGLWARATTNAIGYVDPMNNEDSQIERYLIQLCAGQGSCQTRRGSVSRHSIISEISVETVDGIRKGNFAEMLPGETRTFKLSKAYVFSTGNKNKAIVTTSCTGGLVNCPFTASISAIENNDFSVSAKPGAGVGLGNFQIALKASDNPDALSADFVLDMNARIFGNTNLFLIGYSTKGPADLFLNNSNVAYKNLISYYSSLSTSTINIKIVRCQDYINPGKGKVPTNCSDEFNKAISTYASKSKLQNVLYFGHGAINGVPIPYLGHDWIPDYSPSSFASDGRFTNFSCHGALSPGLDNFGLAWRVPIIANEYYTSATALRFNKTFLHWDGVEIGSKDGDDIVFHSSESDPELKPKVSTDGQRRNISPVEPYKFVQALPIVDPTTGSISFVKSSYAMEDYRIFKVDDPFNFPKVSR